MGNKKQTFFSGFLQHIKLNLVFGRLSWVLSTRLFIVVFGDFFFDCQFHTGDMSGNPAGEITVSSWVLTVDLMIKYIKKSYFGSNLSKTQSQWVS